MNSCAARSAQCLPGLLEMESMSEGKRRSPYGHDDRLTEQRSSAAAAADADQLFAAIRFGAGGL